MFLCAVNAFVKNKDFLNAMNYQFRTARQVWRGRCFRMGEKEFGFILEVWI